MEKLSQQSKVLNILFFCTLLFQDAGTFGVLPVNLFQIIEFIMLITMFIFDSKIRINNGLIMLFGYIGILTIINPFDVDSVKTFVFFVLSITMYYLFLQRVSINLIKETVYNVAFLLSIYGCIQEFGFILKMPFIYDISNYGFALNGLDIGYGNLMRVNSLYAEPAHLGPIFGLGILIGLIDHRNNNKIRYWKTTFIIICALLTQSFLVYANMFMALICFTLFYQEGIKRKLKKLIIVILIFSLLCASQWDLVYNVIGRLAQFKTLQTETGNDLSALAIMSNFQVALEKMKDGYLFGTGLDSHRLYYDRYINQLYSYIYMKLNFEDAASMYTRIFSEFGLLGLMFFCWGLTKRFLWGLKRNNKILVITVLMFLVGIMRDGNYMRPLIQIMFVGIVFSQSLFFKRRIK